jgi:hypothetical protein
MREKVTVGGELEPHLYPIVLLLVSVDFGGCAELIMTLRCKLGLWGGHTKYAGRFRRKRKHMIALPK